MPTRPRASRGLVRHPDDMIFAIAYSGVQAQKTGPVREKYKQPLAHDPRICDAWIANGNPAAAHRGHPGQRPDAQAGWSNAWPRSSRRIRGRTSKNASRRSSRENCRIIPAAGAALKAAISSGSARSSTAPRTPPKSCSANQIPEDDLPGPRGAQVGRHRGLGLRRGFRRSVWALVKRSEGDSFVSNAGCGLTRPNTPRKR